MGAKRTSRLLAVLVAVVMMMTSAVGVFAAGSSTGGQTVTPAADVNYSSKTIVVNTNGATYSTDGGKTYKSVTNNTIYAKSGSTVIVKQGNTTSYLWMQTAKVSKAKKGKVTWKKTKKAKKYQVYVYNKKGKVVKKKTVKGTSYSSKKYLKKGYKVKVRPITVKKSKSYLGAWTARKKIK
jgi:hypothetical protein